MNKTPSLSFYAESIVNFYGIVEEVIDESYVRVRCLGIHPLSHTDVSTQDLPPALVLYPVGGGQVSGGSFNHNLEVDSWVFGHFLDYPLCQQPVVTNVVQGAAYSMSDYNSNGGEFVGQGNGTNNTGNLSDENANGGNFDQNPSVDTTATTNIPGGSNIEKAYNYVKQKLIAEGSSSDPHLHASGVLGVLMLETPGVNPRVVGGYRGRAWGICQWLGPRRKQLFDRYGQTKDLSQQLDFMWWELNNTERRSKSLWLKANNLPDAVAGFCMFERAEEVVNGRLNRGHKNYKARLKYAYQIYNSMKGK